MARATGRSTKSNPGSAQSKSREVAPQNVEILNEALGVDLSKVSPDQMKLLAQTLKASVSSSPYTSGEMLAEYRDAGFPEIVNRALDSIDQQRDHRQNLEISITNRSEARKDRSQTGAQVSAILGLIGALIAGYFKVPSWICIVAIIFAIGGPNAATIAARMMDRVNR